MRAETRGGREDDEDDVDGAVDEDKAATVTRRGMLAYY